MKKVILHEIHKLWEELKHELIQTKL